MTGITHLPPDLPQPGDDRADRHLHGARLADVALPSTDGPEVSLQKLHGLTIVYIYPMTGRPDVDPAPDWNAIPGARGCTPQSLGFRDHFGDLRALGVDHVFGLSTQTVAEQSEAQNRLHLPYPLLSDADGAFLEAMHLPWFLYAGVRRLKRMVLVIRDGWIEHVFYPVFPPDRSAACVVDWLVTRNQSTAADPQAQ